MRATLLALALLTAPAFAADPHAHEIPGGWWECDQGYVSKAQVGGAVCAPVDQVQAERFVVSTLPSAGEGSRQVTTRTVETARPPVSSGNYVSPSGWLYTPGNSAFYGGTLSRAGIGSRVVIALPPLW